MTNDNLAAAREAFEEHLTLLYGSRVVKRDGDGYVFDSTNHEWVIWQGAWQAAQKQQPIAGADVERLAEQALDYLENDAPGMAKDALREAIAAMQQPAPVALLGEDERKAYNRDLGKLYDRVQELEEALTYATTYLEIAGDWGAPKHCEMEVREAWDDTKDADSSEPDFVALYLLCPKLWGIIKRQLPRLQAAPHAELVELREQVRVLREAITGQGHEKLNDSNCVYCKALATADALAGGK